MKNEVDGVAVLLLPIAMHKDTRWVGKAYVCFDSVCDFYNPLCR